MSNKVIVKAALPKTDDGKPYSPAVGATGPLIFVSGQLGFDPATGKLGTTIVDQTRFALKKIEDILIASGTSLKNLVKVTVLLDDIKNFETVNKVYKEVLKENFPARTCYQVAALPLNGSIEIEGIAAMDQDSKL